MASSLVTEILDLERRFRATRALVVQCERLVATTTITCDRDQADVEYCHKYRLEARLIIQLDELTHDRADRTESTRECHEQLKQLVAAADLRLNLAKQKRQDAGAALATRRRELLQLESELIRARARGAYPQSRHTRTDGATSLDELKERLANEELDLVFRTRAFEKAEDELAGVEDQLARAEQVVAGFQSPIGHGPAYNAAEAALEKCNALELEAIKQEARVDQQYEDILTHTEYVVDLAKHVDALSTSI